MQVSWPRSLGSLVCMEAGQARAYEIDRLQDRGTFFIDPGQDIYIGPSANAPKTTWSSTVRGVDQHARLRCRQRHAHRPCPQTFLKNTWSGLPMMSTSRLHQSPPRKEG